MEEKRKVATPRDMYKLFLFTLLFYIGGSIVLGTIISYINILNKNSFQIKFNIITSLALDQGLIWGGVISYMLIKHINPFVASDFKIKSSLTRTIFTVLLIPIFTISIYPMITFLNYISLFFVENVATGLNNSFMEYPFFVQLLVVAGMPAISEELLCRGVFMGGLKRYRILSAAFISGLLFGLLHLNFNQFFYAAFLGIMIALLNECTGNIYSSMLVHFLINGFSVVISRIYSDPKVAEKVAQAQEQAEQSASGSDAFVTIVSLGSMAVIGLAFAIFLLMVIAVINKREQHFNLIFHNAEDAYGNPYSPTTTVIEFDEQGHPYHSERVVKEKLINKWFYIVLAVSLVLMILFSI